MADISKLEEQANLLMNNVSGREQNLSPEDYMRAVIKLANK